MTESARGMVPAKDGPVARAAFGAGQFTTRARASRVPRGLRADADT